MRYSDHVRGQGFVNGLYYDPNRENTGSPAERDRLLAAADLVRAGLAGNLSGFAFTDRRGQRVTAAQIDYHGQGAGYASDPQETVNYVAAHDNETLFDINQYKLHADTPMADRVRAVNLANSLVMLAQGVPFFHAGQELLQKDIDNLKAALNTVYDVDERGLDRLDRQVLHAADRHENVLRRAA